MIASPSPPRWAHGLLRLVLRPDDLEAVSGDLIEEYRETVHPARGSWRADVWFVRQVAGFAWRSVWAWALLLAVFTAGRAVLDTFAPPADWNWGPRSAFTTWSSVGLFALAGAWGAWRSGRVLGGTLAALAAHLIGFGLSVAFGVVLFVSAIQHNPGRLDLFQMTGGWGEEWGVPLMLVPVVLTLGTVGGIVGRALRALNRRQRAL